MSYWLICKLNCFIVIYSIWKQQLRQDQKHTSFICPIENSWFYMFKGDLAFSPHFQRAEDGVTTQKKKKRSKSSSCPGHMVRGSLILSLWIFYSPFTVNVTHVIFKYVTQILRLWCEAQWGKSTPRVGISIWLYFVINDKLTVHQTCEIDVISHHKLHFNFHKRYGFWNDLQSTVGVQTLSLGLVVVAASVL